MSFSITHWMIWVALFALFLIVELATTQMVSIWFAVGSLCAAVVALVTGGDNLIVEIIVFAVVTAIVLILTKPLVRKITNRPPTPTNADALVGMEGIVTVHISNTDGIGEVQVKGNEWTARTEEGAPEISFGTHITVLRIEGAKLIVAPKEEMK